MLPWVGPLGTSPVRLGVDQLDESGQLHRPLDAPRRCGEPAPARDAPRGKAPARDQAGGRSRSGPGSPWRNADSAGPSAPASDRRRDHRPGSRRPAGSRGGSAALPTLPAQRGLRRLRTRGNAAGGQYGRWLLRYFGVPRPIEDTARWMGQYHGGFADLPLSLCETHLWLWDRPPIAESPAACWLHLGIAAVALRRQDLDDARLRLERVHTATDPAALVESALLAARLEMDAGQTDSASKSLAQRRQPRRLRPVQTPPRPGVLPLEAG